MKQNGLNPICFFFYLACLIASYNTIPVATAAFKLSVFPRIGIFTFTSDFESTSFDIPLASLPIIIAVLL